MPADQEFGIVGLGQIGGGLAQQALSKGARVVGYDQHGASDALRSAGIIEADDARQLIELLSAPRIVFLYVPAGPVVDSVIDDLLPHLQAGDVIVDGGNSYWGDSIHRHQRLAEREIGLVDLGTSGGIDGARRGACFMAGGERRHVELVEPILLQLAVSGGYVHAGGPGSGHFVKLVHNGIEFGMLQAIGEGVKLLTRHADELDIAEVLRCWSNGSVIRSWLIELMEREYRKGGGLQDVPAYVEDTGEVNWLVADAMQMEVSIPVMAMSIMELFASRESDSDAQRSIALMRRAFGGHPLGHDESISRERRVGRVGKIVDPSQESFTRSTP